MFSALTNCYSWEEYFEGIPLISFYNHSERIFNLQPCSIIVNDCYFNINAASGLQDEKCGGAICIQSEQQEFTLLVEHVIFYHCVTYGCGGAVYFQSLGECVISYTCGVSCDAAAAGSHQYYYIYTKDDIDKKNYILYSSVTKGSTTLTSYCYQQINGHVVTYFMNITYNKNAEQPAFFSTPSVGKPSNSKFSNEYSSYMEYCTGRKNNPIRFYIGSMFTKEKALYYIGHSNFLENEKYVESNKPQNSLIYCVSDMYIEDCCFYENSAPYILYETNGQMVLNKCTKDFDETKTYGDVVFIGKTFSSFINEIVHFKTGECFAEIDSIEGFKIMTPKTPIQTIPPPTRCICTEWCENKIFQRINYSSALYIIFTS